MTERRPWGGLVAVGSFIVLLALIVGVGLGIYALVHSTAHVRGQIASENNRESGTNQQFQKDNFPKLYEDIQAQVEQGKVAKANLDALTKSDPGDLTGELLVQARNAYQGVVQICISNVGRYNALAEAFSSAEFLPANLPSHLDPQICEV